MPLIIFTHALRGENLQKLLPNNCHEIQTQARDKKQQ